MITKPASLLLTAFLLSGCFSTNAVRTRYLEETRPSLDKPARPLIVVPGFGISKLYDAKREHFIWGTPKSMIVDRFPDDFDLPLDGETNDSIVARGFTGSRSPMNSAFKLGEALKRFALYGKASESADEANTNLYLFAYDWRQSYVHSASELARYIEKVRAAHGGAQVDLLTHSAGAAVAIALLEQNDAAIANVIMLAPPLRGSIEAFRLINDEERFWRRTLMPETSATLRSVPELFPDDGRILMNEKGEVLAHDIWDPSTWRELELSIYSDVVKQRVIAASGPEHYAALIASFENALQRARKTRDGWNKVIHDPRISVIASDCVPTTRRVLIRNDGTVAFYPHQLRQEEASLGAEMFEPGDGSIPLRSATLGKERTTILCDGHFALALDPSSYRAIIRTLNDAPQAATATYGSEVHSEAARED
jgi:pimeloyl-ACP methyl ester carboxylesterase